jgi:hypothetical protein
MRTPDILLSRGNGETPQFHFCRACRTMFQHRRRGGNVFCSPTCNSSFGGGARKALYLLVDHTEWTDLTSRAMLDFVAQTPSRSKSSDVAEIREELDCLDRLLSLHGPFDVPVPTEIKKRADSIRSRLETRTFPNWDEVREYVHALEILRDTRSDSPEELMLRRTQAWAAVWYYLHIKENPSLSRALQAFANLCRMQKDQRTTWKMTRFAHDLLTERRHPLSPKAWLVFHHASILDLRSCTEGYGDALVNERHNALLELAGKLNTPMVWFQTWQELAGYYGMRGSVEQAEGAIEKIDALRRSVRLNSFSHTSSLRAKIELYSGHCPERMIDLIEREYVPAYRASPRAYHLGHLQRWEGDLGLSLPSDLPRPYHESPILLYMPRGEL